MKKITILSVLILLLIFAQAQTERTINGTVKTDKGEALAGVNVSLKSTSISVMTTAEGTYGIKIPESIKNPSLIFSYIGFKTKEVVVGDSSLIDVILEIDDASLDEVLVTGIARPEFGTVRGIKASPAAGKDKRKIIRTEPIMMRDSEDYYDYEISEKSESEIMSAEKVEKSDRKHPKKENSSKAGLLTAGEIHDFSKWELWQDIDKTDLNSYIRKWQMKAENRYTVQVSNNFRQAVPDADVYMISTFGDTLWAGKTDNTGKAELWANFITGSNESSDFEIHVEAQGKTAFINNPTKFQDGINFLDFDIDCSYQENVDIAFVVDATGSMGDEINYLKAEMSDIIGRLEKKHKDINLRTASVFYRDKTDAYLVRQSPFSDDSKLTTQFIQAQHAAGGGDFPEAVDAGLEEAINKLEWRKEARSRILFLILDAPPHSSEIYIKKMQKLTKQAAAKGIRIIPVTGSGTDKSTEYLMRTLALATNGTYVFLTDDSGVGGSHIKPTTDKFDVESMNKLLIRLLDNYLYLPECVQKIEDDYTYDNSVLEKEAAYTIEDGFGTIISEAQLKIFPNPTNGAVTIKGYKENAELFLTDMSGKILKRIATSGQNKIKDDFGNFPSGIYFISYGEGRKRKAEKIIIRH